MLRQIRRLSLPTGGKSADWRRGIAFSEQSDALAAAQKKRSLKGNLWFSTRDLNQIDRITRGQVQLKSLENKGVEAHVPRRSDLYNLAQIEVSLKRAAESKRQKDGFFADDDIEAKKVSYDFAEPQQHCNLKTRRPFSKAMLFELQQRATMRKYSSKLWVTAADVRTSKGALRFRDGEEEHPVQIVSSAPDTLFHVTDFNRPLLLLRLPIWGGSARLMTGERAKSLTHYAAKNGWIAPTLEAEDEAHELNQIPTYCTRMVFFAPEDVHRLQFVPAVGQSLAPFKLLTEYKDSYRVHYSQVTSDISRAVAKCEAALATSRRANDNREHIHLFSQAPLRGTPLTDALRQWMKDHDQEHGYWVGSKDVETHNLTLKEGADKIPVTDELQAVHAASQLEDQQQVCQYFGRVSS